MSTYFIGMDLAFLGRVREIITLQGKADQVVLLPTKYVEEHKLFRYDEEAKKLVQIENIKEHEF